MLDRVSLRIGAMDSLVPGPLIQIGDRRLVVDIAPQAGGRIAQIAFDGVEWLVGYGVPSEAAIAWGCFPMVPWAGRVRRGRFSYRGCDCQLPANLGEHAIHGMGFVLPWRVERHSPTSVLLSLRLPEDQSWPFGGSVRQLIEVEGGRLHVALTLTAGEHAMPATIGWHPWFKKPDRIEFRPSCCYPRDEEGVAHLPLVDVPAQPWDDCFINVAPVSMVRGGQQLQLISGCDHWVIFDEPSHATCVEPQTGPPNAFNLGLAQSLDPGEVLSAQLLLEWTKA